MFAAKENGSEQTKCVGFGCHQKKKLHVASCRWPKTFVSVI